MTKCKYQINIDLSLCIGCSKCVKDCVFGNLSVKEHKAVVLGQKCIECGHCVAVCPTGADSLLKQLRFARSVRQFKDTPVQKEIIDKIIEAGRLTPTASNSQKVEYVVIDKNKDELHLLLGECKIKCVSSKKELTHFFI